LIDDKEVNKEFIKNEIIFKNFLFLDTFDLLFVYLRIVVVNIAKFN
jgi:hypothetical protein